MSTSETSSHLGSLSVQRKHKSRTNNTRAPSSLHKRLNRQLAGIMAHLEKNPGDVLSRARVATIQQLLRQ